MNDIKDYNVPENKILVIPLYDFDIKELNTFFRTLKDNKKREWFKPNFYRCLPLTIGNQYGFGVYAPYSFGFNWNGGTEPEDITFFFNEEEMSKFNKTSHFKVESHFGEGIITLSMPVLLRSPNGVNLMTIAPPNSPLPNLSPMTGVVEADNLRTLFTINLKIDIPDISVHIPSGTPLAGILPVPRYFCDSFEILESQNFLPENIINQEKKLQEDFARFRAEKNKSNQPFDRLYMKGLDFYGKEFGDHQRP